MSWASLKVRNGKSGTPLLKGWNSGRHELPAESVAKDGRPVPLDVVLAEVCQLPAATANQLQQPTARVMIVAIEAQVRRQAIDPLGKERDLDFRRTGVGVVQLG